jgi:hypothetical protein
MERDVTRPARHNENEMRRDLSKTGLAFAAARIYEDEKTWKSKSSSLQVSNGEGGWPGATSDLASNWPCRQGFSCGRAGEPAVVTLDTTAVPHLVVRPCINNTLIRENIWWGCMIACS